MVINFFKGIMMGLALVIPGLSASTFAVVLGIYDRLMESLSSIRKDFKGSAKFLWPIGLGAAVGILATAGFLLTLIERFELLSYAFFVGLVLGSVPVIYRKLKPGLSNKLNFPLFFLGLAVIIAMGLLSPTVDAYEYTYTPYYMNTLTQALVIFGAGFIACFLIALPGVSGAMILILIGQFDTIYGAVDNFARSLIGQMDWYYGLNAMLIVGIFFVGAVIGLLTAAKLIGELIKRHEVSVYFAVMGLVLGAVYVLYTVGMHHNVVNTFNTGGLAILRDVVLIAASTLLGYLCTGLFGRRKKPA